ncbi:Ubiquinone biosynthesis protein COQ7 [Tetrabaena socialis]|uniref:Ubiquinone biosynthesis protein COQ7 n=1 Tax=Tetrabaena socialis TaxID=47790 RepID=A0A2J8AE79_9CHLO|nr:Ubiquinone biosynthesis protein COQ7 [Tetrabaena socialis]|eukprot:PNH10828.1 Ubiquinone biosynthesis protein COQ7 [Tetrabaena socialis]
MASAPQTMRVVPRLALAAAPGLAAGAETEAGSRAGEQDGSGNAHSDTQRALKRVLRSSNAAELAAVHFFQGASCVHRGRPDVEHFAAQEQQAAESVRQLLPKYRVRPSAVQGPLSLASWALGAVAAVAPQRVGLAITGAVGDALTDHYNEQLRRLNEAGAAQQATDVRLVLRQLRDVGRTPEGAPPAPDLVSVLQEGVAAAGFGGGGLADGQSLVAGVTGALREMGLEGTVGAVVKASARVALETASRA